MFLSMRNRVSSTFRSAGSALLVLLTIGVFSVSGCSSGSTSSKPQLDPITFTDANGTSLSQKDSPTSLTVGQSAHVDVTLTNDSQLLGADWNVVCGSALPPGTPLPPGLTQDQSCGTFTPAHTMSGPIPPYLVNGTGYVALYTAPAAPPKQGVVTLYASATSDHSRFTTVTLTIVGNAISVGFAPVPPSAVGTNGSVQLRAALNNDVTNAGVNWSVVCGSSNCGYFGPTQTVSGVATTYTAPGGVPTGGSVQVTATSIADPTKAATATIQIAPVSVSVTPTTLSVPTAGTGSLTATVANDGGGKGVDWSVTCANTLSPGKCGSITSHTASGVAATYTAPSVADIAVGSTVVITATSTADPAQSVAATVTAVKGDLVAGNVRAAQQPVSNAQVTLYAAETTDTALNSATNSNNASAIVTAFTDRQGSFFIPYGYECPRPDTQMYLIATGGNAGGGTNPNLALISALGSCSNLDASRIVINEATTVAATYALSSFMADAQHIGSNNTSPSGVASAFATARDLVDVATGLARIYTVSGKGSVPQTKINTLANLLNSCARTAGSVQGDGSTCDQLFRATTSEKTPAPQVTDTAQALLQLVRNATSLSNRPDSLDKLYQLAESSSSFGPTVSAEPNDWTLAVQFLDGQISSDVVLAKILSADETKQTVDSAGNVWVMGSGNISTEFIGGASYGMSPNIPIPIEISGGDAP